jgi:hypothetical protein
MINSFPPLRIFDALDYTMKYYPDKYNEQARIEIETLLDHCLEDFQNDSEKFLSTLMIKALRHLIGPGGFDEHIYLKKFEITQIELFNVLIKEFPFVKYGHEISNTLISNKIGNKKYAAILDIGMGQGVQMQNLIYKLDKNNHLEKLTIIGIEPFQDAIHTAQKIFKDIADEVSFEIELIPWNTFIQDVSREEMHKKLKNYRGELIINSSLAMHHIQSLEQRNIVLSNIHSIHPKGIILMEPNSDHFEPDFYKRFQNCYQHFYHIFQVIDNLDIDQKAKSGLKLFFGREIEDIIGKPNDERYEKHEPAYRWIEKLVQSGFKIRNNFLKELPAINTGIKLNYSETGFLGFTYKTETVLSIIYAEAV